MRAAPPTRSRGAALGLVAALALSVLGGCRGNATRPPEPIDPSYQAAFEGLAAAVGAHEDELARHILERILARGPEGPTLRRAEAFDRVLGGRALGERLRLELGGELLEDGSVLALFLEGRHDLPTTVRLRTAPGTLKCLWTGVAANGVEQRAARTVGAGTVSDLSLPPGETVRVELGEFPFTAGTALAVRGHWRLVLVSGEIEYAGESFPANEIPVAPYTTVRLAGFLPSGAVEPGELLRYLEGEHFSTAAMLERTVRIELARRKEALDLLTPLVLEGSSLEVERTVPALRWLSGNRELGGDPSAWRRWMRARSERQRIAPQPDLLLPESAAG